MERYTCNGAYLEKFSNGAFVKYSDHVAEVGKITDQLESLRTTLCSSLVAHSDHAAELARVEGERDANRRLLNKALKENTLLRAECEACRSLDKVREDTFPGQPQRYAALSVVLQARAATDAAGILKGAGT